MFQAVFATFFGLMSLYQVKTGNYNYHKYVSVGYQISPMVEQTKYYENEVRSSGTAVTFLIDDSTEVNFRDNRSNYERHVEYYFYNSFGEEATSQGSVHFALIKNQNDHYDFRVIVPPHDKTNLDVYILIEYTTPSNNYSYDTFEFTMTNTTNVEQTFISTIPSLDTDYFDDGGTIEFTIQTSPIDEESWTGTYEDGYDEGYTTGYNQGQQDGFAEGYETAIDSGSTAATIFSGIVTVGLLPVNFFLGIMNFEVFGINIGAFISALMTIAIIIIVIKIIIGSKGGGA